MKKIVLLCLSLLVIAADAVYAQQPANANKITIGVVWIPELNSEVYAVDERRFNNLDLLKIFLHKAACRQCGGVGSRLCSYW